MAKLIAILLLAAVGQNAAQDCVRANSEGGDSLPSFSDPGNGAPRIEVNPVQVIIMSYQFHCCGKVGGWAAYVQPGGGNYEQRVYSLKFQIWRPSGNNRYVKIGENSFPLLTLTAASRIEEELSNSEQLNFQPGDVVGYYLEDNRNEDGSIQFDTSFNREELWYATGNSALQDECLLEVGSAGDLSMSTTLGPIISISLITMNDNCPSTFTSTMFCPTMTPTMTSFSPGTPVTVAVPPSSTPLPTILPVSAFPILSSVLAPTVCNGVLISTVTISHQPTPTLIATPTQPSAAINLGLFVGVSVGLLVLVLCTVTLVGLACMRLTRKRRNVKAQRDINGLVSYKNVRTNTSNLLNENTEPSTESNIAYGELTKSTISDYDYAPTPSAIRTSDLSTTTKNPAYGDVTRGEEVDYTYIELENKDTVTKHCGVTEESSSDPVVGQNPAYGGTFIVPDDEYIYINEDLNSKEGVAKTGHIKEVDQLHSDPVVGENAAYGAVKEFSFNSVPSIPTRENLAYLSVNNDSELMDTYDYVRQ